MKDPSTAPIRLESNLSLSSRPNTVPCNIRMRKKVVAHS
jgi:hypothetical protein